MFTGVHALVYSRNSGVDRAFFRDVLGLRSVDAGRGWLIFALPPAEMAFHPCEDGEEPRHELWLMCDDVAATAARLEKLGVAGVTPVRDCGWGLVSGFTAPSGAALSMYQPKHPTAIAAPAKAQPAAKSRRAPAKPKKKQAKKTKSKAKKSTKR